MAILSHEYWKKFIEKDKNGKEKGNGREFEKLVRYLLYLMYGKKWREFYDYSKKHRLTAMYNENNEIIEWYFDIARKIEKDNGMPYEDDLYLDVVVTPTGDIILLGEDELKKALDRFEVNKSDYDMAYNEAKKLIELLEENKDKLKEFTDKYFNKMLRE